MMNKEERKEYNQKYYQEHKEEIKKYHRNYYQEHKDYFREYEKKAWEKRHPDSDYPLIRSKNELKQRLPQLLKQDNHRTLQQITQQCEEITSRKLGTSPSRIRHYLQQHPNITVTNGIWSYHDME